MFFYKKSYFWQKYSNYFSSMKWKNRPQSQHVEDRRRRRMRRVGQGFGLGTILLIVLALFLGQDPMQLLQQLQTAQTIEQGPNTSSPQNDPDRELKEFVSVVLKDTEDVWEYLFKKHWNQSYPKPTLVIYSGIDRSLCGVAQAATGPFYCPADKKIYIDLSFFRELRHRFGAPGDFAIAYVIAHEVGHHVQNVLGISEKVQRLRQQSSRRQSNRLSVRLELQADFLAGIWAHHAQKLKNILEEGDIEEALNAAAAVGDDRLQKSAGAYVMPDAFTHGSSEQRMRWFLKGWQSGDINQGNTFDLPYEDL